MKNFLTISILFFTFNFSFAQCKYKGIPKAFLKFSISDNRPIPDKATKPKEFMTKLDFSARISAVKSGEFKFFHFHFLRSNSKRFNINTVDPLELTTEKGKKIILTPSGDYQGKKSLTSYVIGVFYKVSDGQLEILSKDPVESLRLNITSEKEINGGFNLDGGDWIKDPNGDIYYMTSIESKSNRDKLVNLAKCLKSI